MLPKYARRPHALPPRALVGEGADLNGHKRAVWVCPMLRERTDNTVSRFSHLIFSLIFLHRNFVRQHSALFSPVSPPPNF